ncbi:uncharacterized protein [Cherax quadricarinatus]|uniref:uncharacterized protein n=1 Tax=Cherax quadricarinatus TaxID=27406 RepID=UPI0023798D8A|nr:uncharacterized protein LOC128697438 [Cherax quadricarinatus]XP_053645077.1 uncharacterized protein LOC128697438 [Cherax quadricarinatus]
MTSPSEFSLVVNSVTDLCVPLVLTVVGVSGLVGAWAELPCRFAPRTPGDKPKLILWYKQGVSRPLFSHDSREPQVEPDLRQVGVELRLGDGWASLAYQNLSAKHAGVYECRVDFYTSPAYTSLVNLTVVEPVRKVEILAAGKHSSGHQEPVYPGYTRVLGPYYPGHTINISCLAHQGWPPPVLTWWLGDKMLKSSRQESLSTADDLGVVQNDLVIENASRSWNERTLTCTANNTHLASPAAASVVITMFLLPSSVVVDNPGPVVEGRQAHLRCLATGAQPQPKLTWSINGTAATPHKSVTEGRVTWSTLVVNVTRGHHQVKVTCTATSSVLPGLSVSNYTLLTVYYPPSVWLSLGRSLQPDSLKEGDDVYFTCTVSASPPASTITWFHQGRVMVQNVSGGVVMSGDSLVLQGVSRHQAGHYRCGAANPLARVVSAPALLRIKYKPECLTSLTTYFIYDKPINITCTVTSHPPVSCIHWQWKNNDEVSSSAPTNVKNEVSWAVLTVRPYPGGEDRTLSCWGVNDMGTQVQPCKLAIKELMVPQSSCRVANITSTSLSLACHTPHLDPHTTTLYTAEVYFDNRTLFANVTSNRPNFNVSRLDAGTSYQIKVYVTHGPVTSQPVLVSAYTSRSSLTPADEEDKVVEGGVLGGVVGGVVVTAVVVGGGVWARLYWTKKITARRNKSLRLASADDTRPMLNIGASCERSTRRASPSRDFYNNEETMYQAVPGECEDAGSLVPSDEDPDDEEDLTKSSYPHARGDGGSEGDGIATVEEIFKVVVNPHRQSATIKKLERGECPSSEKTEAAAKEADNYLGEWLQLFPKESEDKLARKLQHVSKKDDEYIGEWLQHLPQDAHDYPGGWVINSSRQDDNFPAANLHLFPKTVEEPPGGWMKKSPKEERNLASEEKQRLHTSVSESGGGWQERSPQGAEGYPAGALKRPQKLAESYEDWRLKYAPDHAEHFKFNTLQSSSRALENQRSDSPPRLHRDPTHHRGWTLPRPPKSGDNFLFQAAQNAASARESYPGRLLHRSTEARRDPIRRRPRVTSSGTDEGGTLRRMRRRSGQEVDLESDELPCSVHQLLFAEETIL